MMKLIVAFRNFANLSKNAYWSYCTAPAFCQILVRLEFSRHIFEKYSSIKFHANPSSESRVVSREQTDGQTMTYRQTDRQT